MVITRFYVLCTNTYYVVVVDTITKTKIDQDLFTILVWF